MLQEVFSSMDLAVDGQFSQARYLKDKKQWAKMDP